MSILEAHEPVCRTTAGAIRRVVAPRPRDLDGFTVRRVLPAAEQPAVGPFVFFDEMGPADFAPGEGIQVRPHPHIGLATVTYLFAGEILHRDSLGTVQPIRPGAVNLMTAGRGIVHSERAGEDLHRPSRLHGIQTWMALPETQQETEPAFAHFPAEAIPVAALDGCRVHVIIGSAFGVRSPVLTRARTRYLELRMAAGATAALPGDGDELGCFVVRGTIDASGQSVQGGQLAVATPGSSLELLAKEDSHVMVVGGEPLGHRHLWWNFVSTSSARIERAKDDWRAGRFPPVPGDDEFIPLPEA